MLTLPIKKKWCDMILSGEKKEEYREITPYWTVRFMHWLGLKSDVTCAAMEMLKRQGTIKMRRVILRNGYGKNAPRTEVLCTLRIGTGHKEWGAEQGKEYFVLTICEVLKGGLGV